MNIAFPPVFRLFACLGLALVSQVANGQLNPQEAELASYLVNDGQQQRPFMTLDPILSRVARQRAADMAARGYFSHTNPDGLGPNYLLRQAGYTLPSYWPTDLSGNNVESIGAGYATAGTAWSSWMGSPLHRTHLLGEQAFYASQTSYGIGFSYNPASPYQFYWVVITAPPNLTPPAVISPPSLVIHSPAAGQRFRENVISIAGVTGGSPAAGQVQWQVQNSSGTTSWATATGTANWSAAVGGLVPGKNLLRVASRSAAGQVLMVAERSFTYVVDTPLQVNINGSGTVTTGFAGRSLREIARSYAIQATAADGYLFTGWTGSINSRHAYLTFKMQEGMVLQANFIANPFLPIKGTYNGLLSSQVSSTGTSGFLTVTLGTVGRFTGKVIFEGKVYLLDGRFDLGGEYQANIAKAGQKPLMVNLQLDVNSGTETLSGSILSGTRTSTLLAKRGAFSSDSNPAPQAGQYTVVLPADPANSSQSIPQGDGFAKLTVDSSGRARITGSMADGKRFSEGVELSTDGRMPVYISAYEGDGSVSGELGFRNTSVSDLDGVFTWLKPARKADRFYPEGFLTKTPVVGSRYEAPKPGSNILGLAGDAGRGFITLGDGNLDAPITRPVVVGEGSEMVLTTPSAENLALTVSTLTGVFTGTFIHPVTQTRREVRGVVFQKQGSGYGFFPGADTCGYFSLIGQPSL